MSVKHGQCDARPTVTFPAARHHRPPIGWYQIILLGDKRPMYVNNLLMVALDSGVARIRTRSSSACTMEAKREYLGYFAVVRV